jgi:hypothetical protein
MQMLGYCVDFRVLAEVSLNEFSYPVIYIIYKTGMLWMLQLCAASYSSVLFCNLYIVCSRLVDFLLLKAPFSNV